MTSNKATIRGFLEFMESWNNNDDHITQKTSGSTGAPKTIPLSKEKMLASARMTGEFLGLNKCSNALLCISPSYIGGKMMIVRSGLYNLELTVGEVSSNPLLNASEHYDFAAMVPLQVETILNQNPEKLNLIRVLIIGGAPVSNDLANRLKKSTCRAFSTYGMTETLSHVALKDVKKDSEPFRAIGNTTFRTEHGKLIINCPELGIPELHTNDLVELIDEKSFFWKGRADFVINSGGIKLHPEQIEQKLHSLISPTPFIVGGLPDSKLGEKPVLILESENSGSLTIDSLRKVLEKFEVPKAIIFTDKLSYTSSGKIDRRATVQKVIND
ncbi:MAG: AMP-binding protein [Brumimicrobium sp.]|nr:AMP-binding protein [Brumimicrobium sp.]